MRRNLLIALAVTIIVAIGAGIFLGKSTAPLSSGVSNTVGDATLSVDIPSADNAVENILPPDPGLDNAAAPARIAAIPADFLGDWNRSGTNCTDDSDDSHLLISEDALLFYESEGQVTRIVRTGDHTISVTADYTGEGSAWTRTDRLALSPDGGTLTIGGVARRKCA